MPARVEVDGREVVVRLSGSAGFWAFSGGTRIPFAEITSVEALPRGDVPAAFLRVGGTNVPGLVKAGRFWSPKGGRELWFARRGDRLLVIQTTGRYSRVVLETADPDGDAGRIRAALRGRSL